MKKLLVVRNDKIGDFVLAWPSFVMLKQSLADTEITALVTEQTAPLAELCPWIDRVVIDCGSSAGSNLQKKLHRRLRKQKYDGYLCFNPTLRNAWLGFRAGIRARYAPSASFANILFNHRVKQRRGLSAKPEFEHNLELTRFLLESKGVPVVSNNLPFLRFTPEQIAARREREFANQQSRHLVMVHIGSGGSASNLSFEQYLNLIECLSQLLPGRCFVITAGPGELVKAQEMVSALDKRGVCAQLHYAEQSLVAFCEVIACAELFIAASTGPLHIAGGLDVPTVGFYPDSPVNTAVRWRTLNSEGAHLPITPPYGELSQEDMIFINTSDAAVTIAEWWAKR